MFDQKSSIISCGFGDLLGENIILTDDTRFLAALLFVAEKLKFYRREKFTCNGIGDVEKNALFDIFTDNHRAVHPDDGVSGDSIFE